MQSWFRHTAYLTLSPQQQEQPAPAQEHQPQTGADSFRPPAHFQRGRRIGVSAECGLDPATMPAPATVVHSKTPAERAAIEAAVRSNALFRLVSEEQLQEVVDSMVPKRFAPGDIVIQQGACSSLCVCVCASGADRVHR
jgi:hypothetical protein